MRHTSVVVAMIGALAVAAAGMRREAAQKPEKAGWTNLFDGTSMSGWTASEHPESWKVKDGTLACHGERAHLFYTGAVEDARFQNFEAEVEVKTSSGANSGVFILTAWQDKGWPAQGFEIQVNNTQPVFPGDTGDPYRENKRTGSLYGIRNTYKALARDNEWFTLQIRVQAPRIVVHVNDALVVDYVEPEGEVATLATPLQKIGAGTFALQCHDGRSPVQYRRIAVHPLPPTPAAQAVRAPNPDPAFAKRYRLARDNFPLVDLHALDVTRAFGLDKALAGARAGGLFVGLSARAGARKQIHDDHSAARLVEVFGGKPLFLGLRVDLTGLGPQITKKGLAGVDFVMLDGEAVANYGRPPSGDAQAYVDTLLDATIRAFDLPVDVYAAPTSLPARFAADREALWTEARQQKLIDAAVAKRVAFEINGRLQLPGEAFVRKAKAAGATFTLGECALETPAGAYCFDIVEKAGLGWRDMYEPGHEPPRAAR
jgi:3-keto-disaccharide hydrolase